MSKKYGGSFNLKRDIFKTQRQIYVSMVVLGIYMVLLIWLILFKLQVNLGSLMHIRNINLIPYSQSMIVNGQVNLREIIYNVIVFIPMGVYISMFKPEWPLIRKVLPCAVTSLVLETLQYVMAIGASDITDVIDNTLGGIIGIGVALLLARIFKDKTAAVVNSIGIAVEVLSCGLFVLILAAN